MDITYLGGGGAKLTGKNMTLLCDPVEGSDKLLASADVVVWTTHPAPKSAGGMNIDSPGEYEVKGALIHGMNAIEHPIHEAIVAGSAINAGGIMMGAGVIVAALAREMAGSTATHGADPTAEHPVPAPRSSRSLTEIYEMIPGLGEPVSLHLHEGDYAVGRSLGTLDLRDTTDATVLVILRGGEPVVLPVGREVLRAGDTLALAGTPAAVERAAVLLAGGPVALSDGPGKTP